VAKLAIPQQLCPDHNLLCLGYLEPCIYQWQLVNLEPLSASLKAYCTKLAIFVPETDERLHYEKDIGH